MYLANFVDLKKKPYQDYVFDERYFQNNRR